MRIILTIDKLSLGGAQRNLELLSLELLKKGLSVQVIALLSGGLVAERLKNAGVQIEILPDFGTGIAAHAKRLYAFSKLLRKLKPGVVQSYLYFADLYSGLVKFTCPFKLITSRRQPAYFREPGNKILRKFINSRADQVTGNAEQVAKFVSKTEGYPFSKIRIVRNGIPLPELTKKTEDSSVFRILSVGNLTPVKGHQFLLESLKIIKPERPVQVTLVGDGSEREKLESLAEKLPDEISVVFEGKVQATDFFPKADLFILPSRSEGTSNALLEAMSYGICSIATCTGGTPEIIKDGEDGLLTEYNNPEQLAVLINRLLNDDRKRDELGAKARAKIELEYSLERLTEETIEMCRALKS